MGRQKQRKLFDENRLPWEEAPQATLFAQVVFDRPLRTPFSYAIPADLESTLQPGMRVLAPLGRGNHRTRGFCVGLQTEPPPGVVKPILGVLDETSLLRPSMLELTRWIADYYWCGWGQVLEAVVPAGVKQRSGQRWAIVYQAVPNDEAPTSELTAKQKSVYDALVESGRPMTLPALRERVRVGPDCVKALVAKGWATTGRVRQSTREARPVPAIWDTPPSLHAEQQAALDRILEATRRNQHQVFLLRGVTGSGKTEVYLRAIADVLKVGKQAIVLVPEISLTPQTIQRFRARFENVAVLHSRLSDAERAASWRRIAAGEIDVVVGARSAVFAPVPQLGLIVIDEEHETTFKQESVPRYHAREVGIERSRREGGVVILGSATPSLESENAARDGRFTGLVLSHRVLHRPFPTVELVDLRNEPAPRRAISALSGPLARAMSDTLESGGEVLLLLNRRGFSTSILCPSCGHVARCANCDIALTFHKEIGRLLCHACDAEYPLPDRCESCHEQAIRYSGLGIQRVEEEVKRRFPHYPTARMDSDTMRSSRHYEEVLSAFRRSELRILLGTQMIAKGLDFPNVRLVGVVSADTARSIPDFRSAEKTFQLVTQVAGRAGRGDHPGRVLVQTFHPDDPALKLAVRHDFTLFAEKERQSRREFGYPPFSSVVRIIFRGEKEPDVRRSSASCAEQLRSRLSHESGVRILGPAPAPVTRIKGLFRMHLQIHSPPSSTPRPWLRDLDDLEVISGVEFAIDVDPVNFM